MKSLFPDSMMESEGLTMEIVASKLTYFHDELQLLHWKTMSYAEHMALGGLYEYVHTFKDDAIEKLMGYCGRRVETFKVEPLSDKLIANAVVTDLDSFAKNLVSWAASNNYADIENLAQSLSGEAVKTSYLLTLS